VDGIPSDTERNDTKTPSPLSFPATAVATDGTAVATGAMAAAEPAGGEEIIALPDLSLPRTPSPPPTVELLIFGDSPIPTPDGGC
jgi:hypothetical protein